MNNKFWYYDDITSYSLWIIEVIYPCICLPAWWNHFLNAEKMCPCMFPWTKQSQLYTILKLIKGNGRYKCGSWIGLIWTRHKRPRTSVHIPGFSAQYMIDPWIYRPKSSRSYVPQYFLFVSLVSLNCMNHFQSWM